MTVGRESDPRIAAFFEGSQPDLPDRAFDAVRRDIHRTRQTVVVGPWRLPVSLRTSWYGIAAAAVVLVGVVFLNPRQGVGPGGRPSPTPTLTPAPTSSITASASADLPTITPGAPAGPTTFTSPLYGYTVTIPTGWIAAPALLRWDGVGQPGPDADADKFDGPSELSAWVFAGPFSGDLADFATDRIEATARDHADTCPVAEPEINEPAEIGGGPGTLLGWNCGALINQVITLRDGVAYSLTFRDLGIRAATDPADRALLQSILDSFELPQ